MAYRLPLCLGRICPNPDASLFFDPDEIEAVFLFARERWPAELPTLNRAPRKIARIGDFFGRRATANLVLNPFGNDGKTPG